MLWRRAVHRVARPCVFPLYDHARPAAVRAVAAQGECHARCGVRERAQDQRRTCIALADERPGDVTALLSGIGWPPVGAVGTEVPRTEMLSVETLCVVARGKGRSCCGRDFSPDALQSDSPDCTASPSTARRRHGANALVVCKHRALQGYGDPRSPVFKASLLRPKSSARCPRCSSRCPRPAAHRPRPVPPVARGGRTASARRRSAPTPRPCRRE